MEFTEVIKNRYSCKKFSNEKVDKEKLNAILIISGKRTLDKRKMIVYNAIISNCK